MKKFDDYVLDSLVGDRELLKTYLTELDNEHTQQLAKEKMELVEEIEGMNVTTRTWGKFFKGTSFDNDKKSSIDIKCAYTNGYNQALDDIISALKSDHMRNLLQQMIDELEEDNAR